MKCACRAGILDAFLDKYLTLIMPSVCQQGPPMWHTFLAGQRERNLRYYTDWIKDPGYFGIKSFIKTGNLFGLQHIYGDMSEFYRCGSD